MGDDSSDSEYCVVFNSMLEAITEEDTDDMAELEKDNEKSDQEDNALNIDHVDSITIPRVEVLSKYSSSDSEGDTKTHMSDAELTSDTNSIDVHMDCGYDEDATPLYGPISTPRSLVIGPYRARQANNGNPEYLPSVGATRSDSDLVAGVQSPDTGQDGQNETSKNDSNRSDFDVSYNDETGDYECSVIRNMESETGREKAGMDVHEWKMDRKIEEMLDSIGARPQPTVPSNAGGMAGDQPSMSFNETNDPEQEVDYIFVPGPLKGTRILKIVPAGTKQTSLLKDNKASLIDQPSRSFHRSVIEDSKYELDTSQGSVEHKNTIQPSEMNINKFDSSEQRDPSYSLIHSGVSSEKDDKSSTRGSTRGTDSDLDSLTECFDQFRNTALSHLEQNYPSQSSVNNAQGEEKQDEVQSVGSSEAEYGHYKNIIKQQLSENKLKFEVEDFRENFESKSKLQESVLSAKAEEEEKADSVGSSEVHYGHYKGIIERELEEEDKLYAKYSESKETSVAHERKHVESSGDEYFSDLADHKSLISETDELAPERPYYVGSTDQLDIDNKSICSSVYSDAPLSATGNEEKSTRGFTFVQTTEVEQNFTLKSTNREKHKSFTSDTYSIDSDRGLESDKEPDSGIFDQSKEKTPPPNEQGSTSDTVMGSAYFDNTSGCRSPINWTDMPNNNGFDLYPPNENMDQIQGQDLRFSNHEAEIPGKFQIHPHGYSSESSRPHFAGRNNFSDHDIGMGDRGHGKKYPNYGGAYDSYTNQFQDQTHFDSKDISHGQNMSTNRDIHINSIPNNASQSYLTGAQDQRDQFRGFQKDYKPNMQRDFQNVGLKQSSVNSIDTHNQNYHQSLRFNQNEPSKQFNQYPQSQHSQEGIASTDLKHHDPGHKPRFPPLYGQNIDPSQNDSSTPVEQRYTNGQYPYSSDSKYGNDVIDRERPGSYHEDMTRSGGRGHSPSQDGYQPEGRYYSPFLPPEVAAAMARAEARGENPYLAVARATQSAPSTTSGSIPSRSESDNSIMVSTSCTIKDYQQPSRMRPPPRYSGNFTRD